MRARLAALMPGPLVADHVKTHFPGVMVSVLVALAAQFVAEHYGAPAMLMALLDGIENKIDPGVRNDDNLYEVSEEELKRRGIDFLPSTLREALARPSTPRNSTAAVARSELSK